MFRFLVYVRYLCFTLIYVEGFPKMNLTQAQLDAFDAAWQSAKAAAIAANASAAKASADAVTAQASATQAATDATAETTAVQAMVDLADAFKAPPATT